MTSFDYNSVISALPLFRKIKVDEDYKMFKTKPRVNDLNSNFSSYTSNHNATINKKTPTDFSIAAIIGNFGLSIKDSEQESNHNGSKAIDLRRKTETPSSYFSSGTISSQSSSSPHSFSSPHSAFSSSSIIETSNNKQQKFRPKNFNCPLCHLAYSNNGQLKNHVRIHTGERPFQCNHPDCSKSFTRNEELTRHKLIHTGVRPHCCQYCGKKFGRKDHLKKHVRTHDRKQDYQRFFEVVCQSTNTPPSSTRSGIASPDECNCY